MADKSSIVTLYKIFLILLISAVAGCFKSNNYKNTSIVQNNNFNRNIANINGGKTCFDTLEDVFVYDADTIPSGDEFKSLNPIRASINNFIKNLDKNINANREFVSIITTLPIDFYSPEQVQLIEGIVKYKLNNIKKKAIFLVSILGRYKKGTNQLLNYSENYSWAQIRRKSKLLKMAGFSLKERRGILWAMPGRHFSKLGNLFNYKEIDINVAKLNNANILKYLASYKPRKETGKISEISDKEAHYIYRLVNQNPVSSLDLYNKYNPIGADVGFCWGRAMTVQLEAIARKIAPDSIKKVFAVGDLNSGNTNWRYHVTTIIKGKDRTWWAIDPIMGREITLDEWTSKMNVYNKTGNMRFFITEGDRYGPSRTGPFIYKEKADQYYNHYFRDLLNYFHYRDKVTPLTRVNKDNFIDIMESEVLKAKKFPDNAPPPNS